MNILRALFDFLYGILLGCRHDHQTRPFTIEQQTYKVCLDCGKHVFYSADTMRPLSGRELRRMNAVQSGELKVVPVSGATASLKNDGESRAVA
ncbi:hypothetical protein H7849_00275 [Alloacidobacterium dinghuense]|uniref:Uncharacterized protein n=1 Tax=Alloacidobacterium dinghuense TaxID=2763107 RepID=A0A7G8BIY6_9BACT|nr:hypothetical protein [Alloacidobacterium dinghuense]QNI32506.1 hypothetical protein H7849_00275 [Alloacidobacterium dinghuense]